MVFGCYSLASIGTGLITFKDCPEEADSLAEVALPSRRRPPRRLRKEAEAPARVLLQEVKEAMSELRAKGVYPQK